MNHYQVLGVKETASKDEITRAYRKLALTCHPDKNKSSNASDQFRSVNEAYKILKDDHKRELYDRFDLPTLRQSKARSHDRYSQPQRRTKHDEQFFTGSSETYSEEQRYQNELERIRKINSDLLDSFNSRRRRASARSSKYSDSSSSKRNNNTFVGEILADKNDDEYEKIVLERLRATIGRH